MSLPPRQMSPTGVSNIVAEQLVEQMQDNKKSSPRQSRPRRSSTSQKGSPRDKAASPAKRAVARDVHAQQAAATAPRLPPRLGSNSSTTTKATPKSSAGTKSAASSAAPTPTTSSSATATTMPPQSSAVHNAKAMAAKFRLLNAQAKPVRLMRQESAESDTTDDDKASQAMKERIRKIQQIKERSKASRARLMKLPSRGSALKEAVSLHDSSYALDFHQMPIDEDAELTEQDMKTLSSHSENLLEKHGGIPTTKGKRRGSRRPANKGKSQQQQKRTGAYQKKTSLEAVYKLLSASDATLLMDSKSQHWQQQQQQQQNDMQSVYSGDDTIDTMDADTFAGDDESISLSSRKPHTNSKQDKNSSSSGGEASRWKVHDAEAHVMAQGPTRPMRAPRTPSGHSRRSISLDDFSVCDDDDNNNEFKIVLEMTPGTRARIVGISKDEHGNFYMSPHTPTRGGGGGSHYNGMTPLSFSPSGCISELSPFSDASSYMDSTICHTILSGELSPGTWVLLEDDSDDDDADDDYYEEDGDDAVACSQLMGNLQLLTDDSDGSIDVPAAADLRTVMAAQESNANDSAPRLPARRRFSNDGSDQSYERQRQ